MKQQQNFFNSIPALYNMISIHRICHISAITPDKKFNMFVMRKTPQKTCFLEIRISIIQIHDRITHIQN